MKTEKPLILRLLLWPFSAVYWLVVTIRNLCFDAGILPSKKFDVPVISVGNITVGGTGKTPFTEYLIKMLKMRTVCEGVETKENVDYLTKIGCDSIQGYYYSKPIPSIDFKSKYFTKE